MSVEAAEIKICYDLASVADCRKSERPGGFCCKHNCVYRLFAASTISCHNVSPRFWTAAKSSGSK